LVVSGNGNRFGLPGLFFADRGLGGWAAFTEIQQHTDEPVILAGEAGELAVGEAEASTTRLGGEVGVGDGEPEVVARRFHGVQEAGPVDSDFELDIFDVADAADVPADGDDLVDEIGFEGVLGAEAFAEGVSKRIEFLLVFRGEDKYFCSNSVGYAVHTGNVFAFGRAGAGGFLGVGSVSSELAIGDCVFLHTISSNLRVHDGSL
jgi:hypothetical protein